MAPEMRLMIEPQSLHEDDFAEQLWIRLICDCDSCHNVLLFDDINELLHADPIMWAKSAARRSISAGWVCGNGRITCRECLQEMRAEHPGS